MLGCWSHYWHETNGSQSPSKMGQFLKRAPAAYEVGQCKSDTTLQIARVSVQDNEASQRYFCYVWCESESESEFTCKDLKASVNCNAPSHLPY